MKDQTLLKETKDDFKRNISHVLGLEELILLKMAVLPKTNPTDVI